MSENIKIAVVGSGYVGLLAAVCFAEIGHSVICVDNDERKVAALQAGDSLIHENFLPELLDKHRQTNVPFIPHPPKPPPHSKPLSIALHPPHPHPPHPTP